MDGKGTSAVRRGVKPGSFIDLLVKSSDRETGDALPDKVIAQQVVTACLAS